MTVGTERDGAVLVVTIDRPEVRNAVDKATAEALADAFRAFDADDTLSVAVLTGAGGTFCAGADLRAVAAGTPNRVEPDGQGPLGPTRMLLSKPVVAAVEGHAVAGGLELALWCDLRVVARDAVLGVFCRRFGVPLVDGGTVRLPRLVGMGRALDLILTGRSVGGEEAHRIGLADRLVESGHALAEAKALAQSLAKLPQTCMREDRLSAHEGWSLPLDGALANEFRHGARSLASPDLVDGARSFASGAGRHGGTLAAGGDAALHKHAAAHDGLPTVDDVRAAAERLRPFFAPTPLVPSAWLSDASGADVRVKWETLQPTGSFKVRGALHKLLRLHKAGVDAVLAVSAGNHGLGVAHAARLLGMRATIVVPADAAPTKLSALRRFPVELVVRGAGWDEAEAAARALAKERGVAFVSPYNDADVIAGAATATMELLAEWDAELVVVPVGGGGLIAGAVLAAEALGRPVEIVGAQPRNAAAMAASLAAGKLVAMQQSATLADGLAGNVEPGSITFDLVARRVKRIALVDEAALEAAVRGYVVEEHLLVEGSGAVGAAALVAGGLDVRGRRVATLATGRNIDATKLARILSASAAG